MERNRYFETIEDLLRRLEISQKENIHQAAELIADALPDDYIVIEIEKCYDVQGAEWRRFHIQPVGAPVPWLKEVLAGYEDTSR